MPLCFLRKQSEHNIVTPPLLLQAGAQKEGPGHREEKERQVTSSEIIVSCKKQKSSLNFAK